MSTAFTTATANPRVTTGTTTTVYTATTTAPHSHTTAEEKTYRHALWSASGVFSTIALVSLLRSFGKTKDQGRAIKWAVSGVSCALGLAGIAILANLFLRRKFIGTILEGSLAFMTLTLWAIVIPYIMDPQHNLAVTGKYGAIYNANLYFFSWAALLSSMYVFTDFCRHQVVKKRGLPLGSSKFLYIAWTTLAAVSLIEMAAASNQFHRLGCLNSGRAQCKRTQFALSLGACSAFIALIWMMCILFVKTTTIVNTLMACLLLAAWSFGVAYIEWGGFERAAPVLGNIYFFTWGSFGTSMILAATGLHDMIGTFMGEDMTGHHPGGNVETSRFGDKPADPAAYGGGTPVDPELQREEEQV